MSSSEDVNHPKLIDALEGFDTSVLKGKSVIVTGGASGLGEAFAHEFIKAGAFVTIGDVDKENGERVARELGSNARFVSCDVTNWQDQVAMFKFAIAESPHKSCDIVLANAGIAGPDSIYLPDDTDEPKEPDLSIVKVHITGALFTTKLAMHYFTRQPNSDERDRCLILTSSLAGYSGLNGNPQYTVGKWGIRALMRCLRETSGKDGIRLNVIAPYYIGTRMLDESMQEHLRSRGIDLASISDAAQAVMHFACDKSLTGRAAAIVPRTLNTDGYFDLRDDPQTDFFKNVRQTIDAATGDKS